VFYELGNDFWFLCVLYAFDYEPKQVFAQESGIWMDFAEFVFDGI
jgi:hypothetical protein